MPNLVPRLSLSFSHYFARANFMREKSKERESLVRNPAHPWPPGHGLGGQELYCALYRFRDAFWIVLTPLTGNKGCVSELFKNEIQRYCSLWRFANPGRARKAFNNKRTSLKSLRLTKIAFVTS